MHHSDARGYLPVRPVAGITLWNGTYSTYEFEGNIGGYVRYILLKVRPSKISALTYSRGPDCKKRIRERSRKYNAEEKQVRRLL